MQAFVEHASVVTDMKRSENLLQHKVSAAVTAARRGGALTTLDAMYLFFMMQKKFMGYTDEVAILTEMDTDFKLKMTDHIKVFEDVTLRVVFLDGTEIECKNEEE
jgi:hypothetical protein